MKHFFLAFLLLTVHCCFSQTLKKYSIGASGCSAYIYCGPTFDLSKSQDSSTVYAGECTQDGVSYGVICVKLLSPVTDLDMAESLIIQYADFLKANFEITKSAGYGKGHRLNNNENTRGILDYWEDKEQNNWKIKAWTDGKYIGFLYAYSKKELPESKINLFLDGFRIAGK
ncbi:MAG: hypothetical protein JNM19_02225 [Chitinophagaceae bacterium]|nr:hypothetical protein [Chitinophagaceae bacterium]